MLSTRIETQLNLLLKAGRKTGKPMLTCCLGMASPHSWHVPQAHLLDTGDSRVTASLDKSQSLFATAPCGSEAGIDNVQCWRRWVLRGVSVGYLTWLPFDVWVPSHSSRQVTVLYCVDTLHDHGSSWPTTAMTDSQCRAWTQAPSLLWKQQHRGVVCDQASAHGLKWWAFNHGLTLSFPQTEPLRLLRTTLLWTGPNSLTSLGLLQWSYGVCAHEPALTP